MQDLMRRAMGECDNNHFPKGAITDPRNQQIGPSTAPFDLQQEMQRRSIDTSQAATRMQLPGVPLLPIPDFSRCVLSTSNNYLEDVNIGPNTHIVTFWCADNVNFMVSFQGSFPQPFTAQSTDNPIDPLCVPRNQLFLVHGCSTLYVGIPLIGQMVSVVGWRQL